MKDLGRLIAPLVRRIGSMIARGAVSMANSAGKMQTLQVRLLAGELRDGIEHFEPFGMTGCPLPGAEHITAFLGGDRGHGITLVVSDRRYRVQGLQGGEMAIYDAYGHSVKLTKTGMVHDGGGHQVLITNTPKVRMECSLDVTGEVKDQCDTAGGRTMGQMRGTYTSHTHNETGTVTNTPNQAV